MAISRLLSLKWPIFLYGVGKIAYRRGSKRGARFNTSCALGPLRKMLFKSKSFVARKRQRAPNNHQDRIYRHPLGDWHSDHGFRPFSLSKLGRLRFRRARFQTLSSASAFALTEFRGESSVSSFQPNSPSFSQNSPSLPKKISEFPLPKQHSRNSTPPISQSQSMVWAFFKGHLRR